MSQREQSLWTATCAMQFTSWDLVRLHLQVVEVVMRLVQQLVQLVKQMVRVHPPSLSQTWQCTLTLQQRQMMQLQQLVVL